MFTRISPAMDLKQVALLAVTLLTAAYAIDWVRQSIELHVIDIFVEITIFFIMWHTRIAG